MKQLKFPFKIGNLEVISFDKMHLSYHSSQINLKELGSKFIIDRMKYSENRVKIEYPLNCSVEEEEVIIKSFKILNCLGGQYWGEIENSYQKWNEIDNEEILIASYITQKSIS
jgi:hypothetical protein